MSNPFSYLEKHAHEKANELALVFGPITLTFAQLHERSLKVAAAMQAAGLKSGQVALIAGFNPLINIFLTLGAMHRAAIGAPQLGPKYNPAIEAEICFSHVYIDGFPEEKTVIVDVDWMNSTASLDPIPMAEFADEKPVARLLQTSGTTGQPKVLEFSIEELTETHRDWNESSPEHTKKYLYGNRYFVMLPVSIFVGSVFWAEALQNGNCYYIPSGNKQDDLRMILHYKIEGIGSSPAMLADLIGLLEPGQDLQQLKVMVTGGAAMPIETLRLIRSKTDATIINRYGSTESTGSVAWREIFLTDESNLAGDISDGAEVKIVDENFQELPADEIGKIAVKTPLTRREYRNNPEASKEHFVDGFFYSGDEGFLSETGQLYLVGRSDERMNFGGRKIDPNVVDATITSIQGIDEAAVFGFDQPNGVRGLGVAVVAQPNYTDEKLMRAMANSLGSKRPSILIRIQSIPRNAMGKVQRIELEKALTDEANRLAQGS